MKPVPMGAQGLWLCHLVYIHDLTNTNGTNSRIDELTNIMIEIMGDHFDTIIGVMMLHFFVRNGPPAVLFHNQILSN